MAFKQKLQFVNNQKWKKRMEVCDNRIQEPYMCYIKSLSLIKYECKNPQIYGVSSSILVKLLF